MAKLSGKIAIISGGASGIGAACAENFVAHGAKVVIGDINQSKGRELANLLGDSAIFAKLDVRQNNDWQATIEATQSQFGHLNILVNSAGVSIPGTIEDITLDDFRHTIGINLEGTFLGCKAAISAMKVQKIGSIINVASTMSHRGAAMLNAYCASKGGVRQLTRSVALHCAEQGYGIRVNSISPGAIHTEMVDQYVEMGKAAGATKEDVLGSFIATAPLGRLGRPDEAAKAITFLASDESSYSTGIDIPVDGGFLT